jgi:hypothetical protein
MTGGGRACPPGADDPLFHQPAGQLRRALHLVGDRAELFVEDDVLQLLATEHLFVMSGVDP